MRYPVVEGQPFSLHCPRCRGATKLVLERSLSQEAWEAPVQAAIETPEAVGGEMLHLEAMLDNLRSAWNVGSIFRSADGAGFSRLHLCGISPTPENPSVDKTALGAEQSLPWGYAADGVAMARCLLEEGCRLWALEQEPRAEPLKAIHTSLPTGRLVLVVGNEVCGVDPGILALCERVVYIPMRGGKRSLNVAVAFGIAAFALGGG